MPRLRFTKGGQRLFFQNILEKSGYTSAQLAERCGVVLRTLNDWRREKYLPDYDVVISLSKDFDIPLDLVEKLDSYWYAAKGASKGALSRFKKFGNVGTPEGRAKGGKISQKRRREDPEKYRKLGCIVKKDFIVPPFSEKFAELVGIILGDGAMSNYQVRISLDSKRDKDYIPFVAGLMQSQFGESPSIISQKNENCTNLTLSGAGLVEMLEGIGMRRGNKLVNQVDFPDWIKENLAYRIACTRGLFDTDGGLYFHRKPQRDYLGWCFANFSAPLIAGVEATLRELGFNVKKVGEHKLYMYSLDNISRYMEVVGSSNPKNDVKLKLRRGARAG